MASISSENNGRRIIQFVGNDGKRRSIRLGKLSMRQAESVRVKVENLVAAKITGHAPSDEVSRWLAGLDDPMINKLARAGLTSHRNHTTLQGWLDRYLSDREGELKPESLRKLRQTKDKLLAYYDPQTPLRAITVEQAADWRQWMKTQKLSEAAIKTHCGNAKTMAEEAVRRELVSDNPFQHLKSGPTPSRHKRYVTPDEIDRIIDACPNAEWKLLFGLARYVGLRIPSESHLLSWADVDWERSRLTVRSPKTEHHTGHEQRIVPVTPKLMKLLQDRFDECDEGQQHLVAIRGKGAVIRQVRAIWKRASVEPWARLWQTLRQSCEKEMAMRFPQYAVSKWIGHSITVSGRHYANDVPDELFQRAAEMATIKAVQNPVQKAHEPSRNAPKQKTATGIADDRISSRCEDLRNNSISPYKQIGWSRGESNPRPVTVSLPPLHA